MKFLDFDHKLPTCEGYLPNSLRPISYLGFIWNLYVLGQPNTQNHRQGTHCAKMGTVIWPKIPKNAPTIFGPICLPKPKSYGFSKKNSLGLFFRVFDLLKILEQFAAKPKSLGLWKTSSLWVSFRDFDLLKILEQCAAVGGCCWVCCYCYCLLHYAGTATRESEQWLCSSTREGKE